MSIFDGILIVVCLMGGQISQKISEELSDIRNF
jgi:hypothetical protein